MLFTRTTELVQRLQAARQDLALEAAITKLDRYDLLVLDDLSYVRKDQAETSVLFELISKRYERRSTLITANQPFGEWNKVFPDPAMTIAAIDRLVHHSVVVEMNVESYRQRAATTRKGRHSHQARPRPDSKHHTGLNTRLTQRRTCRLPAAIWRDNHPLQAQPDHHPDRRCKPSRLSRYNRGRRPGQQRGTHHAPSLQAWPGRRRIDPGPLRHRLHRPLRSRPARGRRRPHRRGCWRRHWGPRAGGAAQSRAA